MGSLAVRRGSEDDGGEKELSRDEMVEIFARLPVKSLMRFKCLSKFWYNLISSPHFIAKHSTHNHYKNNQVSLWLFLGCDNTHLSFRFGDVADTHEPSFSFVRSWYTIVGCFNGVVCLSNCGRRQKYALWNPATKQVREIGDSPMEGPNFSNSSDPALFINGGWYGSGFCFDPVTNSFKLAQFKFTVTERGGETRAQVNVFSTATNSWIEKNMVVSNLILGSAQEFIHGATCVNGYMHWIIGTFHGDRGLHDALHDRCILSFDMIDEVFKRIEMPSTPLSFGCRLAAYKGSLALFVPKWTRSGSYTDEIDVWMMNDSGFSNQSWSKLLTCRPSVKVDFAVGFVRKDDVDMILLGMEPEPGHTFYLYDPENGETTTDGLRQSRAIQATFLYRESLASLN